MLCKEKGSKTEESKDLSPKLPYYRPAIYTIGSTEHIQSEWSGDYYDGPDTQWLRYGR